MIVSTRHTGMVIFDLAKSLKLYTGLLGLTKLSHSEAKGDHIANLTTISGSPLEWAELQAPDNSKLRLLQYNFPSTSDSPTPHRHATSVGPLHSFVVDDIDAIFAQLDEYGCTIIAPPKTSPDGKTRFLLCLDPSGNTLELVEMINTFAPKTTDIDLIVYDFDGVMTDNTVIVREDGLESVVCNRSDGWGVGMIRKLGIEQVILSTEINSVVRTRANKLKLECVYGSTDKVEGLRKLTQDRNIPLTKVLYTGNDMNDFDAMQLCGYKVAPADSHPGILAIADHVTKAVGGRGVIRELADILTG